MPYSKLILLILGAILLSCAVEVESSSTTVQLQVFEASSIWWIAVLPEDDGGMTSKVEVHDSTSTSFVTMTPTVGWGYYTLTSTSGSGFSVPLTFRLTSTAGAQITVEVTSIVPGALINTDAQYGSVAATTGTKSSSSTTGTKSSTATTGTKSSSSTTGTESSATTGTKSSSTSGHQTSTSTTGTKSTSTTGTKSTSTTGTKSTSTTGASASSSTSSSSGSASGSTTSLCGIVPTSSEPLKLLVPLYVDPGSAWDELIAVAGSIQIIAIINPNSGPATPVDSSYTTYMAMFKNAGIEMVGYVYTSYGTRPIADVEADIATYVSQYPGLSGIFFDEGSTSASDIPFYSQAYNYVMSQSGYVHSIINPGEQTDSGYLAVSTTLMIFEDVGANLPGSTFSSWVTCAPTEAEKSGYKYRFAGIANTAALGNDAAYISDFQNMGFGMVYVTDGVNGCCTYNSLASYFSTEAAAIEAIN